jgi:hypothetical protein
VQPGRAVPAVSWFPAAICALNINEANATNILWVRVNVINGSSEFFLSELKQFSSSHTLSTKPPTRHDLRAFFGIERSTLWI